MQLGEAPLRTRHEPVVHRRTDGLWEVRCLGCWLDPNGDLPIGIGMPLRSRSTAERIVAIHAYATIGSG
jgi:hypothetical protein